MPEMPKTKKPPLPIGTPVAIDIAQGMSVAQGQSRGGCLRGDLMLASASALEIELGGTIAGSQYDVVNVAGLLSLDGTLDIRLIDGFVPRPGDTFQFLTYGTLQGEFRQVEVTGLPPAMYFEVDSSPNGFFATAAVPEPSTLAMLAAVAITSLMHVRRRRSGIRRGDPAVPREAKQLTAR